MQLRFIGTGAAFTPSLGNNGAFFEHEDRLYLIDCGEQTFARLMRANLLSRYASGVTVVLTHMHADHCGSLGTLCLYAADVLGQPATIIHPNGDVRDLLSLMGVSPSQYHLQRNLSTPALAITPMPTMHAQAIPAFSYLLEDAEGAIYYSGDTIELPPQVLSGLREGSIRHAYQDVGYFDHEPAAHPPHLLYDELLKLVEPALRRHFTLMHFNVDIHIMASRDGFACAQIDPLFLQ